MQYSWIVKLKKNHLVVLDISNNSNRETIFVDGQVVADKNVSWFYHKHLFFIDENQCYLKVFGLNNYMVFFVKLYVNNKLVPLNSGTALLPEDINPEILNVKPPILFKPTPRWYWIFIIINCLEIPFLIPQRYLAVVPLFFASKIILRNCRSNPYKLSIKQRLLLCIGVTIANFVLVFAVCYFLY